MLSSLLHIPPLLLLSCPFRFWFLVFCLVDGASIRWCVCVWIVFSGWFPPVAAHFHLFPHFHRHKKHTYTRHTHLFCPVYRPPIAPLPLPLSTNKDTPLCSCFCFCLLPFLLTHTRVNHRDTCDTKFVRFAAACSIRSRALGIDTPSDVNFLPHCPPAHPYVTASTGLQSSSSVVNRL